MSDKGLRPRPLVAAFCADYCGMMEPTNPFLSPERQTLIEKFETADRIAVGFAMDYPNGLVSGMHAHPRAQLIYGITGVMRVETESALFVLPPTKALLLPAQEQHSIAMEGRVAMRGLLMDQGIARAMGDQVRVMAVNPLLRELIVAACNEPVDWELGGRTEHVMALIVDEIKRAPSLSTRLPLPRDHRLSRVAEALIENPRDPRSLEDWAETCGASSRTLARLFHRETGVSFGQWRLQARLNAAFALLMTDGDIPRVADDVGFRSQSAFGAAFRRTFGLTPGQARSLHLNPNSGADAAAT